MITKIFTSLFFLSWLLILPAQAKAVFDQSSNLTSQEILAQVNACRPTENTDLASLNVFGLSLAGIIPIDDQRIIDALTDLKVKWVRVEIIWPEVQYKDGSWHWEKYDTFFKRLSTADIQAAVSINYIPNWIDQWQRVKELYPVFVREVVSRYKPGGELFPGGTYGVRFWEIFNEPNLPGYGWGNKKTDAALQVSTYAFLLAQANQVIRAQDPSSVILLGGLSPEGMRPKDFLDAFYSHRTQNCFDVMTFHPYGILGKFEIAKEGLRQIMQENGDLQKPIWFNEFGTNNNKERKGMLGRMWRQKDVVNGFFWFSLNDLGRAPGKTFGLLNLDFSPKVDYNYFKQLINNNQGA